MYGKIFRTIYDGTLSANWEALVTFQQLIVLSDVEGVVDMTPDAISRTTGIPYDIITKGLLILEAPDAESRTPDEEGRRIVRVSETRHWGWQIVNYNKYRELTNAASRRAYHREYYHKHRKGSVESQQSQQDSTGDSNELNSNSNKKKEKKKKEKQGRPKKEPRFSSEELRERFNLVWSAIAKKPGMSRQDTAKSWHARINEGEDPDVMFAGTVAAAKFYQWKSTTDPTWKPDFIKAGAVFFGPGKHYLSDWSVPAPPEPYLPNNELNPAYAAALGLPVPR